MRRALGIGMIFQHFTVAPGMTVAENLTLADRELSALIDWKRERARLAAFMKTAPFPLPLDRMVAGLAAGEKQKLEILKQLYTKRRFLILDEPTSVLTPQEADEVLGRLKAMAQAGEISVLMITHKFREVFGVCDDVTVLRRGRLTGQGRVDAVDRDQLAAWMMGADIAPAAKAEASLEAGVAAPAPHRRPIADTLPRLRVVGIRVESDTPGLPAIHDLSLDVRPGEIVGIAGVSGNGQSELMAALTGVLPMTAGHLTVDGYPYRPRRESMRRLRVASLPEEPLHNGCVGRMSVEENLAFRNFDCPPLTESARAPGRWWLSHRRMRAQALERIAGFKVKTTGPQAPMASLSGGNVQRAVLARELSQTPRLLIVANPCFGLDFQAASEIHGRLRDARDAGCAVLLISEDLDELLALSTRLLVLSHGHIAYETTLSAAGRRAAAAGRHRRHRPGHGRRRARRPPKRSPPSAAAADRIALACRLRITPALIETRMTTTRQPPSRRRFLQSGVAGAALASIGAPRALFAQSGPKIRIGFWPVAAGLPFFAAVEKGYFKEAGVDVEAVKFAGAQQVMEAMLSGRCDGSANGTGSANLAIGEIAPARPLQDLRHQPEQREVRARGVPGAQGQPRQVDGRAQGQARRLGPGHPERDAGQDHARARRRRRDERHRAADRPARRLASPPARSTPSTRSSPPAPSAASTARRACSRRAWSPTTSSAIRWRHGTAARPA